MTPALDATHGRPAVVTGQQAGLLGGPLFTLGKLLGAVALARSSGAVPVFWIECDDADIAEVDQVRLPDAEGELRTLSLGLEDDLRPVASRLLPPGVTGLLDEAEALLPAGPFRDETLAALRAAYRPGARFHDAFRECLSALVPDASVVFLDPTTPAAKEAARSVFARVLEQPDAVEDALRRGSALVPDPQVPYLAGELPLFLLDEDGKRRKLERHGPDTLALKGTSVRHERNALLALLEKEPGRFSPGVLLRPIVQDALLPTVAYVAGPAEARYHAQLPPLYALFGRVPPRVVPRPRLWVVDARTKRALSRLGATAADASTDPDALATRAARAARADTAPDPAALAESTLTSLRAAMAPFRNALEPLDPSALPKAFAEAETAIAYHVQKVAKRAAAALERRDTDTEAQAKKLAAALRPGGEPQERALPAIAFLARAGRAALVGKIEAAIDAEDPGRDLVIDLSA